MFHIEKSAEHALKHYESLSQILGKRIKTVRNAEKKRSPKDQDLLDLLEWFQKEEDGISNIQRVITAEPEEIEKLYQYMIEHFLAKKGQWDSSGCNTASNQSAITAHQVECLQKIFNYNMFSKDKQNAYAFVTNTGAHICPYCNQEFVFSIQNRGKFIARSDLDHYLPKSRFPMFALSYYNLIPSGGTCNSNIKGARELDIRKHFHPYVKDEEKEKLKFCMEYQTPQKTTIRLDASGSDKAQETIDFFYLNDVYQFHADETDKIVELFETYPPEQLEYILKILHENQIPFHMDQLLRILYGHYVVRDPENEMMGNLRNDLFQQIKKIYRKSVLPDKNNKM